MVGYVGGQAMAVSSANGRVGNILIQSRDAQIKVEEVLEDMGIISSSKSIGGITAIPCNGTLDVTIGITAAPDIVSNPTDIVLILDRSGSMAGQSLADLKIGVNTFIDIIAQATGGAPDQIGSGSHIGIVSFADTAVQDTGLITSVAALKAATAALTADGLTNHGAAFTQATALLSTSTNNRVMVMFTDGETTTGPDPSPIAAAARAMGITIYCIGLIGNTGIDVDALNDWATDPDVTHVAVAPTSADLEQLFADLAANISVPGATNIVINEALNPDFVIIAPPVTTKGTISLLTGTSFRWSIDQLGVSITESATVTFTIKHIADTTGIKHVDQSLTYTDTEGNQVSFGNPEVFVNCEPTFPARHLPRARGRHSGRLRGLCGIQCRGPRSGGYRPGSTTGCQPVKCLPWQTGGTGCGADGAGPGRCASAPGYQIFYHSRTCASDLLGCAGHVYPFCPAGRRRRTLYRACTTGAVHGPLY